MRSMTEAEKMNEVIKIKDYMETHDEFVKDMVSMSTLFKYSINFDKNGNIMDRDYNLLSNDSMAIVMANIDCALEREGMYKDGRRMSDLLEYERPMFCNMELVKKDNNFNTIMILVIDESIKYDHDVKVINLSNDRKIIAAIVGKNYAKEYLSLILEDKSKLITLMADEMEKFVGVLYPEVPRELAVPIAVSTLFMTISSFHESTFEDNLFKDEEFGWFYEDLLKSDDYKKMALLNVKKINGLDEDDDLSNLSLEDIVVGSGIISKEEYDDLMSYIDDIINPIGEFFKNKTISSEDRKRMVKRHDYMLPKKSRYIKNVEIDEWLDTPLYLAEFIHDDDTFVIAVSDCISKPVLVPDFCDDSILVAVPGNLDSSDKELMVIAYHISKLIAKYVYEDDQDKIIKRTMSGAIGTALKMELEVNPELFDLLPEDNIGIKETIQEFANFEGLSL